MSHTKSSFTMLVSKWASEPEDAKEASELQSKSKVTPKKLVSKWADADEEETPVEIPKSPQSYKRRAHRKSPRKLNQKGSLREHSNKAEIASDDEDDEPGPRGEMSAAAMDFARRLNLGGKAEKAPTNSPLQPNRGSGSGSDHQGGSNVGMYKGRNAQPPTEYSELDEGKLPPLGPAGRSLATRLGVKVPESPKGLKKQIERKLNERKSNERSPAIKGHVGEEKRYMTPRQRRDEERKSEKATELAKQKEHDEKLKKEVSEMFEKMSDKHTNWADLEDDDF